MIQERKLYRFRLLIPDTIIPFMEAYFYAEPIDQHELESNSYVLSRSEIFDFLKSKKICYGIQEAAIKKILQQGYAHHELIALGIMPRVGTDARFKVLTGHKQKQYEALFSQAIFETEYKLLERLRTLMVLPNTPLVRKIPPTRGAPGINIQGKMLSGEKGVDKPFPPYKQANISPEDDCLLLSNIEGIPTIDVNHRIEVTSITILNRDVKDSAYYKGIVVIVGNVADLVRVRALSDIIVLGTVDAAVLVSGRHIFIQHGVKGKDIAILKSQGNIALRFAERMTLEAGLNIYSESLHDCYAVALGEVKANYILGGEVLASVSVWADVAGSPGVDSLLATGQNMYLETEIESVEQNIMILKDKKTSIYHELSAKDMLSSKKMIMRQHYRNQLSRLEYQMDRLTQRAFQLQEISNLSRRAFIHIQTGIYPDTYLRIHGLETVNYDFVDYQIRFIAGRYGIIPDKEKTMKVIQS